MRGNKFSSLENIFTNPSITPLGLIIFIIGFYLLPLANSQHLVSEPCLSRSESPSLSSSTTTKEKGRLPGKLRRRQQGGDGHGAEAIAMKTSSSMCESSTRCGIDDNMKARHRRVASPVATMKASHRQVVSSVTTRRQVTGELRHR
ncbi:unnamed protein product [Cuscuta europaea]|uniref:Uncharacterized protein n=1 Tax=Cuscuta europaea TaxID=41803 RepID=A0A9P1E4S5_CUSEU|nr:unnamed protein product [Cuscuta europaea]